MNFIKFCRSVNCRIANSSYLLDVANFGLLSKVPILQVRQIETTSLFSKSTIGGFKRNERKVLKRPYSIRKPINKHSNTASSGQQSIIAYNLSEELKIDNAKRLLQIFSEYTIVELPQDLSGEAVLLTATKPPLPHTKDSEDVHSSEEDFQTINEIFLFREGSIVFWGVPYNQQRRIFSAMSPLKLAPYENELIQDEREHLNYQLMHSDRSKLFKGSVHLAINQDLDARRLDQFAFSHAIAQSVKLAIWEALLDQYIESVGWVTTSMKSGAEISLTRDQVFRKTGELYELKHNINLESDLLGTPDVYWDRHEQEVLFTSLVLNLNIRRRTEVINEKLNNCVELMNLLGNHMNDKHHVRLEWMIIILIMVEVLFEMAHFFI